MKVENVNCIIHVNFSQCILNIRNLIMFVSGSSLCHLLSLASLNMICIVIFNNAYIIMLINIFTERLMNFLIFLHDSFSPHQKLYNAMIQ